MKKSRRRGRKSKDTHIGYRLLSFNVIIQAKSLLLDTLKDSIYCGQWTPLPTKHRFTYLNSAQENMILWHENIKKKYRAHTQY